jgi:hypothetical protein
VASAAFLAPEGSTSCAIAVRERVANACANSGLLLGNDRMIVNLIKPMCGLLCRVSASVTPMP